MRNLSPKSYSLVIQNKKAMILFPQQTFTPKIIYYKKLSLNK